MIKNKNDYLSYECKKTINQNLKICWLTYKNKESVYPNLKWLYIDPDFEEDKQYRYILGAFKEFPPHGKVLICFGLNPSTGVPLALERTVKKLSNITFACKDLLGKDKYDGWVMLNLFPLRNSNSPKFRQTLKDMSESEFDTLCNENAAYINEILTLFPEKKVDILLAWGENVQKDKTGRLKRCIVGVDDILKRSYEKTEIKPNVYTCYNGHGEVLTKNKHPRHINLISLKNATLVLFCSYKKYINKIKKNLRK